MDTTKGSTKTKQWGLFPPLSTALPSTKELEQDEAMIQELRRRNNFESSQETQRRSSILKKFQEVTEEFVKLVARKQGLPESIIKEGGGKVATYGSFKLGVYGPGSDIDTLIVAPKHVSRADFFEHFPKLLGEKSAPGAIEELKCVPEAHVPIIKLVYSGFNIDLIFARLTQQCVPRDLDLKDDNLLKGLDELEQRCLNGTRVADQIVNLVPQEKTFRNTLRTIKLWAQQRAIYANIMGFPGGVAWAMMVANICQSYPQACGSVVVGKFFHLISNWGWPRPCQLKTPDRDPPGMGAKVWNPMVYRSDKNHLMPVITPAYPSMCATHNITQSTFKIIMQELKRAEHIMTAIYKGEKTWADLFQKHTFFNKDYKYYLSIVSASKSKDAQLIWSGLVESKVRRLVSSIEEVQAGISIARPFIKGFNRIHLAHDEDEVDAVLHGSMDHLIEDNNEAVAQMSDDATHEAVAAGGVEGMEMPKGNGDSTAPFPNGESGSLIYTTTYYIGLELAKGSTNIDITYSVSQFQAQCWAWSQYDKDVNSVKVVYTRNYDLPDDCFEADEVKPTKTQKHSNKAPEPQTGKRKLEETTDEANAKRRQSSFSSAAPAPAES